LFRIGDQPHHAERELNSSLSAAEPVTVPVTINARLERDDDYDFFRFHAAAGETWIFDLRAARNGNGLDAALVLLDAHGRKLEHDEDTFIWDPFFSHTFQLPGEYVAVVQPTHARNDPAFAYQLDIRRAAHLDTVSPLALQPGAEAEMTLYGRGLTQAGSPLRFNASGFSGLVKQARGTSAVASIRVPADARPGPYELRVVSSGLSNPAVFLVDPTPEYHGDLVRPPASITGTAKYRHPERYRFHAAAGEKLVFEVRAQRFGSPADTLLRLLDSAGKLLASNDDAQFAGANFNKDPRIEHKFAEAGTYQLEIRNLWLTTSEHFPFQLLVRPPQPRLELMLATDQPYVYTGDKTKLKVSAVRVDGYDRDVPLLIEGLPPGLIAKPATIPAGKNETEIEIEAGLTPPGTSADLRVTAGADSPPAWRSVRIASGGGEGATFARVDRATLVVAEKPMFSIECAATSLNLVRGGAVDLRVMIRRQPSFSETLAFNALNLPSGVTLETIDSAAGSASLRFRATPSAALGRAARVVIVASAGGQAHEAPRIALIVD
jgi:hypothetical protein